MPGSSNASANITVLTKNINTNYNGNLVFYTSGFQKNYETNRYDGEIVNDLTFNSNSKILKSGILSDFSLVLKNVNTKGSNSKNYKNELDNKFLSQIVLNNKYPLIKKDKNNTKYFTPIFSFRFSPNETKNIVNEDNRLDYFSLFNLDRINKKNMIEGGESLTLGFDFKYSNERKHDFLNLSAGQVFRFKENEDLPTSSTLGQKRSDFIGKLEFSPNNLFGLNYSFSFDNDLKNSNYNFVETEFNVGKLFTSFNFLENSKVLDEKIYISNSTKFEINENNFLGFSTNKNLDINLTEYYDLIYEYKNDCLTAAVEYKKTFYKDADIVPDENIFFTIKIIPFGSINSPGIY